MAQIGGCANGRNDRLDNYRRYMVARGYAATTMSARLSVAADWLAWRRGDIEAAHTDVERWAASRGVGPATTRNLHVALRAFYRWAMRDGIVRHDPTQLADRPRVPAYLPRPAAGHDIARAIDGADVDMRAMLALMACAGLRCVECSRLNWRDVDLLAGTVIVDGKGHRERMIDLSPDVLRALAHLALATPSRDGAVFVGHGGRRLSSASVSQRVARLCRAAGVTARAHQLRHYCATMALRQPGADLLAVRDLLGHASVSTTQVYTAVVPGRTASTSRALRLPTSAA
jgi:site-specific recombinase XerD